MASISPEVPKLPLAPRAAAYGSAAAFAVSSVALPLLLTLIPGLGTPAFAALVTAEGASFIAVMASQIYLRKQHEDLLDGRTFTLPEPDLRPVPKPVRAPVTAAVVEAAVEAVVEEVVAELGPAAQIEQLRAAAPRILHAVGGVVTAFLEADKMTQRGLFSNGKLSSSDRRAIQRAFAAFETVSADILGSEQQLFRIVAFLHVLFSLDHLDAVEKSTSPEAFFDALIVSVGNRAIENLEEDNNTTSHLLNNLKRQLEGEDFESLEDLLAALEQAYIGTSKAFQALKRALPAFADRLIAPTDKSTLTTALREIELEHEALVTLTNISYYGPQGLIDALAAAESKDALHAALDEVYAADAPFLELLKRACEGNVADRLIAAKTNSNIYLVLSEIANTHNPILKALNRVLKEPSEALLGALEIANTQDALAAALGKAFADNSPDFQKLKQALEPVADRLIAATDKATLIAVLETTIQERSEVLKTLKMPSAALIDALTAAEDREAFIAALPPEVDRDVLNKIPQAWIEALAKELRFVTKLKEGVDGSALRGAFRTLKAKHAALPKKQGEAATEKSTLQQISDFLFGPKKVLKYGAALGDFLAPVCAAVDPAIVQEHVPSIALDIEIGRTKLPNYLEEILERISDFVSDEVVEEIRGKTGAETITDTALGLIARTTIWNPFIRTAIHALPIEPRHKKALTPAVIDHLIPRLVDPVQRIIFKDALRKPLNEQMLGREEFKQVPEGLSEAPHWDATTAILIDALGGYTDQLQGLDFSETE